MELHIQTKEYGELIKLFCDEPLEKIEEIRSKLNHKGRGRKMAAKGLLNRVVDAIPKQYRGLFNYSAVENEGKLQLDFSLNDSREKEYLSGMGEVCCVH